jgi:hypothetical protein
MSQKRYHDFKAIVDSKESMEPLALIEGVGPQFGFDLVSYNPIGSDAIQVKLGSINYLYNGEGSQKRDYYLSDKNNLRQRPRHGVITPDGLLTVIKDELEFSVSTVGLNSHSIWTYEKKAPREYYELVVKASHLYIQGETEMATNFSIIRNVATSSIYRGVYNVPNQGYEYSNLDVTENFKTMGQWYGQPAINNSLNPSTEVIVALLMLDKNNPSESFAVVPYRYQWPQPMVASREYIRSLYLHEQANRVAADGQINAKINSDIAAMFSGALGTYTPVIGDFSFPTNTWSVVDHSSHKVYTRLGPGKVIDITGTLRLQRGSATGFSPNPTLILPMASILNIEQTFFNNTFNNTIISAIGATNKRNALATLLAARNISNRGFSTWSQQKTTLDTETFPVTTEVSSGSTQEIKVIFNQVDPTKFNTFSSSNYVWVNFQVSLRF